MNKDGGIYITELEHKINSMKETEKKICWEFDNKTKELRFNIYYHFFYYLIKLNVIIPTKFLASELEKERFLRKDVNRNTKNYKIKWMKLNLKIKSKCSMNNIN